LSAIARSCFLGRNDWAEKSRKHAAEVESLRKNLAEAESCIHGLRDRVDQLQARTTELESELGSCKSQGVVLPPGIPVFGQHFDARLISLSMNLARQIGMRPTVAAMRIFFEWLRVKIDIPTFQSIRGWMQRTALDRMKQAEKVADGIWLVDHTNQIGQERALTVVRVRESKLPPPGTALRHEDLELLTVLPRKEWNQTDVAKVFQDLSEQYGVPLAVVSDEAPELQEAAKALKHPENTGKSTLVFRDTKHFLANRLESLLSGDPGYQEFAKHVSQMRSKLQQTELAPFIPPPSKPKSRFMNLKPLLIWAVTILWHLKHPLSKSRQGIQPQGFEEHFGWLRLAEPLIRKWQQCQQVISATLTFVNEQGLFRGASRRLAKQLQPLAHCDWSRQLVKMTIQFLRDQEKTLAPKQRLPCSTEILESVFALYKNLQRQHVKGGFGGLLLTMSVLLRPTTPQDVVDGFARVKVAHVKAWCAENLPHTLTAKRQTVYREARRKTKAPPRKPQRATHLPTAA
jgi:hypothetical protein